MSGILMAPVYGGASAFVFAPTISADVSNYNLRAAAIAAGWDGALALNATVTINSGIVVSASATSAYAFDTGTTAYPAGSTLTLTNAGYIIGMGGAGGAYSGNGLPGGPALRVIGSIPVTLDNTSGTIGGGGGGGGGGGFAFAAGLGYGGGGGRTGRTASAGGVGNANGRQGADGTFTSGGNGGGDGGAGGTTGPGGNATGERGAGGGGWGAAGGNNTYSPTSGGAAGVSGWAGPTNSARTTPSSPTGASTMRPPFSAPDMRRVASRV